MAQFIGTSMTRGFAGMLTRGFFDNTTEVKANDGTTPVQAFGIPVKWNTTKTAVTPAAAASDTVIGFAVRVYGQAIPEAGGGSYQQQNIVTVLKRGYIAVASVGGTVTTGGQVYLTSTGGLSADSSGNTAIPGAIFAGTADAEGLVEIAYNI
ncbi:structural cement protein Gp24 [Sutterella wadsworthensis]|uniref:structural cement protein Gp24 n=1 Tax=Sutterella wadsworthensis TaxID=40545 RepID=UPI003AF10EBF